MRRDVLQENYFDILQNEENQLLFCVKVRDGEPDNPYLEYDGGANALFYRRPGQVILLDEVHPDARKAVLAAEEILLAEFIPQSEQTKPEDAGVIREYMVSVRTVEKLPGFDIDEAPKTGRQISPVPIDGAQTTGKQILRVSYDFIANGENELMLVMDALDGSADDETAKFVYDGLAEAMLIRNDRQIIHLPVISEAVRDMLDNLEIVMVSEMDGEAISDVYEARVEILDDALPIP